MKKLPIVLLAILMVISLFSCAEPENTPPRYAITYSGIERDPESITAGEKYKLPADLPKPEEGYKLVVKMGNVVLEAGKEYEITADTVLKCSYEKLKFKLTVDGTEQTVEYGDTYTILKKKDGMIMNSVKVDDKAFTEASFVIKKDTTVVYEWREPATYTVSFEGEGITKLPESFTVTEGNTYTLPTTLPENENHKLVVKNGEQEIKPGTEYEISSDITLTCSWERTHYKVSFAGEAPLPSAFNVEVSKKYKLPEPPENENHKLVVKNGEQEIKPDTEYEISSDITLTCSWERTHYKVSFTGADPLPAAFNVEIGRKYKLPEPPVNENHKLVVKDGTEEIKPGTEYEISSDITLTCTWEKTHNKVSFTGITRDPENIPVSTNTFKIPYIKGYYIESIKLGDEEKKPGTDITLDKDITLAYTVVKGSPSLLYTEPDADGNVSVMQYADESSKYTGDIVIPDMTEGGNFVTGIDADAFRTCNKVTSVLIPNTMTSIGTYAFCVTGLKTVTIPGSVHTISDGSFKGSRLESAIISPGVEIICNDVFTNCSKLKSVEIPDSVTNIYKAFTSTGLTSIEIPNGITKIISGTFRYCSKLNTIIIPESVTEIGYECFCDCISLETFTISNKITIIEKEAFKNWKDTQTINIEKGTDMSKWDPNWRNGCNAKVYYDGKLLEPTP